MTPSDALALAMTAHGRQVRKYTGRPYWEHTRAVGELVASAGLPADAVAAAYLHDVLEDTDVTYEELRERAGDSIARLVREVSDVSKPSDGNRAARKALDRAHYARGCPLAQSIKVADLIDNAIDIRQHDPDFAKVYMAEKRALLNVLTQANRELRGRANAILADYERNGK